MMTLKRWMLTLLTLTSGISQAETIGPYTGFQIGETNSHYHSNDLGLDYADTRNLGFSSRLFMGYQFYHPLGLELGYLPIKATRLLNMENTDCQATIKQDSVDLLIKGSLKIKYDFHLIGRFGMSVLQASPDPELRDMSDNDYSRHHVTHVRPVFGLAVSYPLKKNLYFEAQWMHILEHRAIPAVSFIGMGLVYYIGQFDHKIGA